MYSSWNQQKRNICLHLLFDGNKPFTPMNGRLLHTHTHTHIHKHMYTYTAGLSSTRLLAVWKSLTEHGYTHTYIHTHTGSDITPAITSCYKYHSPLSFIASTHTYTDTHIHTHTHKPRLTIYRRWTNTFYRAGHGISYLSVRALYLAVSVLVGWGDR